MAKKESKLEELLEQPEQIIDDIQEGKFLEFFNAYRNIIIYVGGGILTVVLGFVLFKYWTTSQNEEAQNTMFQAVYYFESDSLNKALNGDGNNPGMVDIISDYPFTKAANMANFYAGVICLKQGKYDEAIDYLKSFGASDLLIQARAYSLIGDAYMELKQYDDAISYYKKASEYKPTKQFTPDYLMKLGLAYELNSNFEEAAKAYNDIIEKFPNSMKLNDAKKLKAMNEAKVASN
ncbi:MAG: tetratricopeptide repeat protein [Bacteroidota bacterium]|nr:tetratricopeptide repeat protein [Bacteroidota bacterium]